MAIVRYGPINEGKIAEGVQRAKAALGPDVVRIRYDLDEDWTGEDAIFFRVLLSNEAVPVPEQVYPLTQTIRDRILAEVDPYGQGLLPYFNFRTIKEQQMLKERSWE